MEIIRNDDGSLTVPVTAPRRHDDDADDATKETPEDTGPTTMVLHAGEGGYAEALAEWDTQQNPDHEVVSTASGREEAMHVVHVVAEDPDHVAEAVESLEDADASADALRHVLVGGTPSIQAFAGEVADAEGGDELPHHKATKIIGQVLAEIDSHPQ
ncbi:MAG: hypothetical protein ABI862_15900 [Ilumatobacteraceae bacterium]